MEEDRAAHSDDYPIFQLIPKEMLSNKGRNLKLLPNDLGQWHTKVASPNVGVLKLCWQPFAYPPVWLTSLLTAAKTAHPILLQLVHCHIQLSSLYSLQHCARNIFLVVIYLAALAH